MLERPWIAGMGSSFSRSEFEAVVQRFAHLLRDREVRPGDRVLLVGRNSPGHVAALLALVHLDVSLVLLDAHTRAGELARVLDSAGVRWVVHDRPGAAEEQPADARFLALGPLFERARALPGPAGRWDCSSWSRRRDALIAWSSGTSGTPKGVVRSGRSVLDNTDRTGARMGYREDDVLLPLLPFSHQYGLSLVLLWWTTGCSLVVCPHNHLSTALHHLAAESVSVVDSVPSSYHSLLNVVERRPELRERLERVRMWCVGGAPLTPALAGRFRRLVGRELVDGYGSTEAGNIALATPRNAVGCGQPLDGVDVVVRDEAGDRVPADVVGNLHVHSPDLMEGYLVEGAIQPGPGGGGLDTGDRGYRDGRGNVVVLGRTRAVHRHGHTIYPEHLSRRLEECGYRVEVVALEHERRGCELVFAVVDPGRRSSAEWHQRLREVLPDQERPNRVLVVDELPSTPSGKVDRVRLSEIARSPVPPRPEAPAGSVQRGPLDAGPLDAGSPDAGPLDAGPPEDGPPDDGQPGASPTGAGPDDGPAEAGEFVANPADATRVDARHADASPVDARPAGASPVAAGPVAAERVGASPVDAATPDAVDARGVENVPFGDRVEAVRAVANHVRADPGPLLDILCEVTTRKAADDELRSFVASLDGAAEEVARYGPRPVRRTAVFMPSNVLLYSYALYALVPSLFSREVVLRPSSQVAEQTCRLHEALAPVHGLPVSVRTTSQREFLGQWVPQAEVVAFTGAYKNAETLRGQLRGDQLFLFFGHGVNPFVVTESADLELAATDAVRIRMVNSGQDCFGPDVLFVHASRAEEFLELLRKRLESLRHGPRSDPEADHGPLFYDSALEHAAEHFGRNVDHIVHGGQVNFRTRRVEPTVLVRGFHDKVTIPEFFAPVFNVVTYDDSATLRARLSGPFFNERAMAAMVYGDDPATVELLNRRHTTCVNTTLLDEEDGNRPFGGRGMLANYVAHHGRRSAEPLLMSKTVAEHLPRAQDRERTA